MATKRNERYKAVDQVRVYIWGRFVGAVALDPKYGFYALKWERPPAAHARKR